MGSGSKIIDGLKDAVSGNIARVTIDGQTWVRGPQAHAPLGVPEIGLDTGVVAMVMAEKDAEITRLRNLIAEKDEALDNIHDEVRPGRVRGLIDALTIMSRINDICRLARRRTQEN